MEEMMTGVNFCERDYVIKMVEMSMEKAGRKAVLPDDALIDRCVSVYTDYYGAHYCDATYIYEGVEETVREMKGMGLRLAVCTNKKASHAAEIVDRLIPDLFEIVVGDGMYPHKPDPTGALKIAQQFGVSPSEVLFVGDSDVDMRTAKNAGMTAVGVLWGYRDEATLRASGADRCVSTARDILTLCDGK